MRTLAFATDESMPVQSGWIYAFGLYHPRWNITRHLNSDWSQAVILAKRKSESVIKEFGRIIARHIETTLLDDVEYVITYVPAEEDHKLHIIFRRCATETLVSSIYSHLRDRGNILPASVLMQIKPKPRKQHHCASDAERAENVKGVYAVTQSSLISDKCVILVDDVLTSGATMRECTDVLRSAGARSVTGIVLARTERARAPSFAISDDGWPGGDAA